MDDAASSVGQGDGTRVISRQRGDVKGDSMSFGDTVLLSEKKEGNDKTAVFLVLVVVFSVHFFFLFFFSSIFFFSLFFFSSSFSQLM